MRTAPTPPAPTTLFMLAALPPLTLNMIAPSLTNIATDLQVGYGVISLALGGYLAVTALVELAIGPVADRIGRRPVLLAALAIFTIGSIGCALAQNVTMLLGFRMLQAGAVAGFVLSLAIVRDIEDGPDVAKRLGRISMVMALAPMLGPVLGSLLDAAIGWRAVFGLYAVVGAGLLLRVWVDLSETLPGTSGEDDPSESKTARLLGEPIFWSYALCTAFSTGAFYIFIAGAPLIAVAAFGMTTAQLGVFVGSITAGFLVGSFLTARLVHHIASDVIMLAGRILACAAMLAGLTFLGAGIATPLTFFGCTIFVGLGNGLTMPNANAGAMSVRPRLAGSATGITGALTLAGGAALTSLTGFVLTREAAPAALLVLMLLASFAGLVAASSVLILKRQRRRPVAT
ncbi:MAG: Bcr/CflA family efflux MFS transporter [Phyllobacteriaceae bacterium]|nr:Bcr/CflA family efflux MFS transporter [Phyllobacteriaceae bacterium]